jgi:hypothetical protein
MGRVACGRPRRVCGTAADALREVGFALIRLRCGPGRAGRVWQALRAVGAQVRWEGEDRTIVPKLVTGLKCWHMQVGHGCGLDLSRSQARAAVHFISFTRERMGRILSGCASWADPSRAFFLLPTGGVRVCDDGQPASVPRLATKAHSHVGAFPYRRMPRPRAAWTDATDAQVTASLHAGQYCTTTTGWPDGPLRTDECGKASKRRIGKAYRPGHSRFPRYLVSHTTCSAFRHSYSQRRAVDNLHRG